MTKHMKNQVANAIAGAICLAVLMWNPMHISGAWMLLAAFFFGAMFGQSVKAIVVEGHLLRMNMKKDDREYILSSK